MGIHVHEHLGQVHARLHQHRLAMFGLDRRPDLYEAAFGWLADPLYRRIAADAARTGLEPGALVVDIGTGPGRLPQRLHALRPDLLVEGVDVSPEMIARARATAGVPDAGAHGLRYTVADVARLPHEDRSVALIVSSLSLHHWADPAAGLSEIRRVLQPGGRAWIYDVREQAETALALLRAEGASARVEPLAPRKDRRGRLRDRLVRRWIARLEVD